MPTPARFVRQATLTLFVCAGTVGAAPDLLVADFPGATHWTSAGAVEGKRAFSFGLQTCNLGTAPAAWNGTTPDHPLFTQNIHRISETGIEHIGMGFVFHGFFPLQGAFCSTCNPSSGFFLGDGCSTSDTASILGQQQTLGPRSGVNPVTGAATFPLPATQCAGALCERIQVNEADLGLPGATYVAETIVVHPGDAAAGAAGNNASHRRLVISPAFLPTFAGPMSAGEPAVRAWRALGGPANTPDVRVQLGRVDVPGDGRFEFGARAAQASPTQWNYVYAVENINSHRAAAAFAVPFGGASPSAIGFHDLDYHSGEVYDPTDWTATVGAGGVSWASAQTFAQNPDANALRWGTLYTFRFTSGAHPVFGSATITLFRTDTPGPASVNILTVIPGPPPCPGDATGDDSVTFLDLNTVLTNWGATGAPVAGDVTADGVVSFADLNLVLANFGNGC